MALQLTDKHRLNISLLGAGIGAAPLTLGAVYCTEQLAPGHITKFKQWVADNIVQPYPKLFEVLSRGIRRAHNKYDEQKREERIERGEAVLPDDDLSSDPKERCYKIADALVTTSLAIGFDGIFTYGLQKLLNKCLNINTHPARTTFIDSVAHLGCISLMPTAMFAEISENVHYVVTRTIQKITGMGKDPANAIAVPFTYVSLPGFAATGLASLYANMQYAKSR